MNGRHDVARRSAASRPCPPSTTPTCSADPVAAALARLAARRRGRPWSRSTRRSPTPPRCPRPTTCRSTTGANCVVVGRQARRRGAGRRLPGPRRHPGRRQQPGQAHPRRTQGVVPVDGPRGRGVRPWSTAGSRRSGCPRAGGCCVDARVLDIEVAVIGSGVRRSKLLLPGPAARRAARRRGDRGAGRLMRRCVDWRRACCSPAAATASRRTRRSRPSHPACGDPHADAGSRCRRHRTPTGRLVADMSRSRSRRRRAAGRLEVWIDNDTCASVITPTPITYRTTRGSAPRCPAPGCGRSRRSRARLPDLPPSSPPATTRHGPARVTVEYGDTQRDVETERLDRKWPTRCRSCGSCRPARSSPPLSWDDAVPVPAARSATLDADPRRTPYRRAGRR